MGTKPVQHGLGTLHRLRTCGAAGSSASRMRCTACLSTCGPCVNSGRAAATSFDGNTPPGKLRCVSLLLGAIPVPVKLLHGVTKCSCCADRQPSAAAAASCRAINTAANFPSSTAPGAAPAPSLPPAPPKETVGGSVAAGWKGLAPPAPEPPRAAAAEAGPPAVDNTGGLLQLG